MMNTKTLGSSTRFIWRCAVIFGIGIGVPLAFSLDFKPWRIAVLTGIGIGTSIIVVPGWIHLRLLFRQRTRIKSGSNPDLLPTRSLEDIPGLSIDQKQNVATSPTDQVDPDQNPAELSQTQWGEQWEIRGIIVLVKHLVIDILACVVLVAVSYIPHALIRYAGEQMHGGGSIFLLGFLKLTEYAILVLAGFLMIAATMTSVGRYFACAKSEIQKWISFLGITFLSGLGVIAVAMIIKLLK